MSIYHHATANSTDPAAVTFPVVNSVPASTSLTWATSERDLAAVAGVRARWSPLGKPLPPCGRAPRVCQALLAMSA